MTKPLGDLSKYVLHVKRVGVVDLNALEMMASTPRIKEQFVHARRWLEDVTMYQNVPPCRFEDIPTARLRTTKFVQQMFDYDVMETVDAKHAKSFCNVFLHPEPFKEPKRFRIIKEPVDVNKFLGKETLQGVGMTTKLQIVQLVHSGNYMAAFDFAAYYDQFEYDPQVRNFFVFNVTRRNPVSKETELVTVRAKKLTMGQRQACEVAQTATNALLDFDHKSATESIIDNVIFVHDSADTVRRDAAKFVERCRAANVTLNDQDKSLDEVVCTQAVWGGICLNLSTKEVSLSEKTLEKLRISWSNRGNWTWRQLAAHIGLLFWSWGILEVPMADYFPLLRFISAMGNKLQESPDLWDDEATVWDSAVSPLTDWTLLCLQNTPRLVPKRRKAEWIAAVDASSWGFGYIAFNTRTLEIRCHGEPWSFAQRRAHGDKFRRSTFAEPQGLVCSMCHLLKPSDPERTVRIGTDNVVSRISYDKGFNSHSFDINQCVRRLKALFPEHTFETVQIPGEINDRLADAFSRGRRFGAMDGQRIIEDLRQYVGEGGDQVP